MKPSFQEIELARLSERAVLSLIKTAQAELCGKQSSIGEGERETINGEQIMRLSVEEKVAAAVGALFAALTLGAIAQGQGNNAGQTVGPNSYGPTDNPASNTQMSQQAYNSSFLGRTHAEQQEP